MQSAAGWRRSPVNVYGLRQVVDLAAVLDTAQVALDLSHLFRPVNLAVHALLCTSGTKEAHASAMQVHQGSGVRQRAGGGGGGTHPRCKTGK